MPTSRSISPALRGLAIFAVACAGLHAGAVTAIPLPYPILLPPMLQSLQPAQSSVDLSSSTMINVPVVISTNQSCSYTFQLQRSDGGGFQQSAFTQATLGSSSFTSNWSVSIDRPGSYLITVSPLAGASNSCVGSLSTTITASAPPNWPCSLNNYVRSSMGGDSYVCVPNVAAPTNHAHATCTVPGDYWIDLGFMYGCMPPKMIRIYLNSIDGGPI
jgi:hypothetical protein